MSFCQPRNASIQSSKVAIFFTLMATAYHTGFFRRPRGERSVGDLEAFLPRCEDEACRRELRAALDGPGSVSLYRETLMRYPKEEARFFHFKERQALERAMQWLTEQNISFARPSRES